MSARRSRLWSVVADVVVVLIFVAIGRRNHDGAVDAEGVLDVAAPFLIALAATWAAIALRPRPLDPIAAPTGLIMWIGVIVLRMILRKVAFDGGTATAFVIVATVFLGVGFNGWRAIIRWRRGIATTN